MRTVAPLLLFTVAGLLFGGAWSMRKQGARWPMTGTVGLLALICAAGGVLWLLPGS